MKPVLAAVCVGAAALIAACGGGGGGSGRNVVAATQIQGVGSGTNFGFDIGAVAGNRYYLTDRNNAAVDVFDTATSQQVAQIKGTGANAFKGVTLSGTGSVDNSKSGPNGINPVGNLLYVGDVDSVKIVDPATQQVIKTISVPAGGHRDDEGCVDATHNLYMVAAPEADPPFATLIDTVTQTVVGTITFTDASGAASAGLEACRYDPKTDAFYVNNDGTTANEHGELDVLPGAAIRAIAPGATVNYTQVAGVRMYAEGNCDPTGLALGPGNDIAVGCREGTTGAPLLVQIMDRTTGTILASINAGGGDQLEYDPATNRYFNAASRWTDSGKASTNGACSAASPCTPVLSVIDAGTRTLVEQIVSGNNAHSVAVDSVTGKVFVPISSATSPAGCATCFNEPAELLTFSSH
jgi:YVTN family beta-propeller protein